MENALWSQALKELESQLNQQLFNTWIKPLKFIDISKQCLRLGAPNRFFCDWVSDHYRDLILKAFEALDHRDLRLEWSIVQSDRRPPGGSTKLRAARPSGNGSSRRAASAAPAPLNFRYTFDNFVVGSCNQFAHAAAVAVAESPAKNYNPLFIYGGVGLGKTHLLNAVGHHIQSRSPQLKIIYASSEKFMNELINALRYERMSDFRSKYRDCDVLLIDDIQFMSNKVKTQEEFFYTFNTLFESHRQIVMTSDRFPRDIPAIEERLRSRMEWGLIADMLPPEIETRVAILKKKAEESGIELPQDVAMYLASRIKSNIRELEGGLIRISAFASLNGQEVCLKLAKEVLHDLAPDPERRLSVDEIQKVVAHCFNVKIKDLCSRKRARSLAFPRQVAMYLCRKLTPSSFPEIGEKFGGKDHSTVIHAFRKIEQQLIHDTQLKSTVESIETSLGIENE